MRRIDISMPLHPGMPAFPGDPGFRSEPVRSLARGDPYALSLLAFGSHAGTHIDPPRHFLPEGTPVDRVDLDVLNGPCVVVGVDARKAEIGPADIPALPPGTRRVLFRTANSERWSRGEGFFPDYVALALPAAESLLRQAVRLVGIDSLSVESDPSEKYPVHRRLLGEGVLLLEGLCLAEAPPGLYDLECLPLPLRDGDGGPARAVLRAP
jgi:arylformamidase